MEIQESEIAIQLSVEGKHSNVNLFLLHSTSLSCYSSIPSPCWFLPVIFQLPVILRKAHSSLQPQGVALETKVLPCASIDAHSGDDNLVASPCLLVSLAAEIF